MNKKAKIAIAVGLGLLIVGITTYFYFKSKKPPEIPEIKPEPGKPVDSKPGSINVNPSPKIKVPIVKAKIVPANDLIASNIKAADAKAIYATSSGGEILNMRGEEVAKTVNGKYLGVASYSKPAVGGYWIYFLGDGNVKYIVKSNFIGVKVN